MFSFQESLASVQAYLRAGGDLQRLESDHGIASKSDGHHLILDYDQLSVKWSEPYGYACRGLVLDSRSFEVLCAPIKKFFNAGEHYADAIDWNTATVFEKIDGTMVNRWWSPHTGRFEYSTRFQLPGGLETTAVNSGLMSWGDMIRRCMSAIEKSVLDSQPMNETWTFEVCCPHNMVVVRHKDFFAKLLAIKNRVSLKEESVQSNKDGPKSYRFSSTGETAAFANQHPATELEGFVVVDCSFNRIKIKSDQYVALHKAKDGLKSANNILLLAKSNDYEEMVVHFPEYKEDLDTAAEVIQHLIRRHEEAFQKHNTASSQKDFAIAINSEGLECTAALFSVRAGKSNNISSAILSMPDNAFCKILKPRLLKALGTKYSE